MRAPPAGEPTFRSGRACMGIVMNAECVARALIECFENRSRALCRVVVVV